MSSKSPKELSEIYGQVSSEPTGKFQSRIEKNAMSPEQVEKMFTSSIGKFSERYPELEAVDDMGPAEFAALYKKLADDIKNDPAARDIFAEEASMRPEDVEIMFSQLAGGIEKYPEVWDSQEKAQMLHPKNLVMLASALKEDTLEALQQIKGIGDK